MHFQLVTLFESFFHGPLSTGLMQRAVEAGLVSFSFHNPRDFTNDKHNRVDDRPYGGGPGMVMLAQPVADTLINLGYAPRGGAESDVKSTSRPGRLIYLSPKGKPLTQQLAQELAREEQLTLICGRYEGLDARIEELFPVECISVGDFVLNGGEAAALCLAEATCRLLPGFMGHEESGEEESFSHGLLEYPHYTRPEEFLGLPVPAILRSGDHGRVADWRREESLHATFTVRPDLLEVADLTEKDVAYIQKIPHSCKGRNLYCALVHHPVLDKQKKSVAVSLTNLDIHDIARSSCTFGLGGYYIVTPIEDQQRLLAEVLQHWRQGAGKASNPDRDKALGLVHGSYSVEAVLADIRQKTGQDPFVVGTAARKGKKGLHINFSGLREHLDSKPVLLLLGTGHGLSPKLNDLCDAYLPPIRWVGEYNHLSVRSAAAIIMDRILGDWY